MKLFSRLVHYPSYPMLLMVFDCVTNMSHFCLESSAKQSHNFFHGAFSMTSPWPFDGQMVNTHCETRILPHIHFSISRKDISRKNSPSTTIHCYIHCYIHHHGKTMGKPIPPWSSPGCRTAWATPSASPPSRWTCWRPKVRCGCRAVCL